MTFADSIIVGMKRVRRLARLKLLSFKALAERKLTDVEYFTFCCSICGNHSSSRLSVVRDREITSCFSCGSNKRFRSIVAALTTELYEEIIPLKDIVDAKGVIGIGLSDSEVYARELSTVFSYQNTYYHKEPKVDITSIPTEMESTLDFVISSDVFEHIPPPVDIGFENVFRILKTDGVFIFSVPYNTAGSTIEHYPDLFEYKIVKEKGQHILVNKTRLGKVQRFRDLKFHGGPGSTLEMRVFSRNSLVEDVKRAGFTDIKVWEASIPEFGILNEENGSSFVISMRKGKLNSQN